MRRALPVVFGVLVAALGAYVIIASIQSAGPPTLTTDVFGGALVVLGGMIAFPRRVKSAAAQLVAGLKTFFGRGTP